MKSFLAMFVFQTYALFIEIRLDWIQTCHFPRFWTLTDVEEFLNSCINNKDLGFLTWSARSRQHLLQLLPPPPYTLDTALSLSPFRVCPLLMMTAFMTFDSNLLPLIDGLCSSNPWEFEFLGFRRNRTDDQVRGKWRGL